MSITTLLDATSIRTRFLVSVGSNTTRAALGLLSGLLVARGLSPSGYGDFTFLMGSFVALKALLDLGSANAFFTLISQRPRQREFYLFYFAWQAVQFFTMVAFVALFCPPKLLNEIWLGNQRGLVLLAFLAAFAQQQMWQTVSQVGESSRQSVRIQVMNLGVAAVHLLIVTVCLLTAFLSVGIVFGIILAEYTIATVISSWFLHDRSCSSAAAVGAFRFSEMCGEFWNYCKPLTVMSVVTFMYFFADRWLLQHFGGSKQQGFYQIAAQFGAVSLLATTSILSIFWKEIAEAQARGDTARVARLYWRVLRGLVMVSAVLSGLLIPWSRQLIAVFLGQAYSMAAPVLAIMFLYPILQSMGQINGTMLLASGKTRAFSILTIIGMLVSVPITYFVQAPRSGGFLPGLGLGAMGMGIKMVGLAFVTVNVQGLVVARINRWKFDWIFQVGAIGAAVLLGYLSRFITYVIWPTSSAITLALLPEFVFCATLYVLAIATLLWIFPELAGLEKSELRNLSQRLRNQFA